MNKTASVLIVSGLLLISFLPPARAQSTPFIHVSGRYIIGPCGDTLTLRGVNYAPYNWGWSPNQLNISQVAQSGANCIRLPWYQTTPGGPTPQATYDDLVKLDSALSKCIQSDLVPILELHDQTCQNDPAALTALASWYTQPAVLALISQYQASLIINIANEALYVDWTGNPSGALNTFLNTYTSIINTLRGANIHVPLMVDGPDCGTNLDVLANIGPTLQNNDPDHNLIFSAHAYWYAYANNDSTQMAAKINSALSQNIPFLFGEVANLQDDITLCQYTLNYQPLLNICQLFDIGWLAWSWDNDGCPARQVTTNGNFGSLTAYGNVIVNNSNFGLSTNPPAKSEFLVNNGCLSSGFTTHDRNSLVIYPNPGRGTFLIDAANRLKHVAVYDITGMQVPVVVQGGNEYLLNRAAPGIYIIRCEMEQGTVIHELLEVY